MSWLTPLPPPEVNNYVYMAVSTAISGVYDPALTPDYITHMWDASGRVASRTIGSAAGTVTETTSFGYHDRLLNLVLTKPAPTEIPCPLTTLNEGNNYSLNDNWTYRYGPGGIREQKRLMTSPQHDRMPCGVAPWVAYVLSPGGQQLAVYHGRQVSESSCTPAGFGQYERRVHIYPVEFRSYGPDGINVIFERNAGGVMTKRFVTTNNQGSIVSVTDNAGYEASAVYDNFGSPTNAYTRRTGWLDRERDFETSPLSDKHKLYDLEARKYDASTGQFLSVDPLWMKFLSSSSYVYCEGDPVNGTDPSGLAGDGDPKGYRDPQDISPWPRAGSTKSGEDWRYNLWFEGQLRFVGLSLDLLMGPDKSLILANNEAWKEYTRPKRNSSELKGAKPSPNVENSDRRAGGHRIPVVTKPEVVVTAERPSTKIDPFALSMTLINGTVAGVYQTVQRSAIAKGPIPTSALGTGMVRYLQVSKGIGYFGIGVDLLNRGYMVWNQPSFRNLVKLGVGVAIPFLVFLPGGAFVVIGVSAAEMIWGDNLYNLIPN